MRRALAGTVTALVALGLLAAPAHAGDTPAGNTALFGMDRALERAWPSSQPGGVIAGVWLADGRSWVGSVGKADMETGRPMRPGLQLPIGSTTKTLTGTLVLQEVQKGTIKLTDTLDQWYPDIPKADEITVAMLLNMSSGIADAINEQLPMIVDTLLADPHHRFDIDEMTAQGASLPRVFDKPGSQFAYSNTNTNLLGRILEKVTGRSYEGVMRRELLKPLGMDRTYLLNAGGLEAPFAQTYSTLFSALPDPKPLGRTTQWSTSWGWAAGGLASTIDDLHAWGEALGTGAGVLSPATQELRLSDCSPMHDDDPRLRTAYCLGLVAIRDARTGTVLTLWHNGQVFGAVSYVGYYPQTGAVVAIQANTDAPAPDGKNASMATKAAIEATIPGLLGLPS